MFEETPKASEAYNFLDEVWEDYLEVNQDLKDKVFNKYYSCAYSNILNTKHALEVARAWEWAANNKNYKLRT